MQELVNWFAGQMAIFETKYLRVDKVNFLKIVFHKIYSIYSWILCPICLKCVIRNIADPQPRFLSIFLFFYVFIPGD